MGRILDEPALIIPGKRLSGVSQDFQGAEGGRGAVFSTKFAENVFEVLFGSIVLALRTKFADAGLLETLATASFLTLATVLTWLRPVTS